MTNSNQVETGVAFDTYGQMHQVMLVHCAFMVLTDSITTKHHPVRAGGKELNDEYIRRRCFCIATGVSVADRNGQPRMCDIYLMRTLNVNEVVVHGIAIHVANFGWYTYEWLAEEFELLRNAFEFCASDVKMDAFSKWVVSDAYPAHIINVHKTSAGDVEVRDICRTADGSFVRIAEVGGIKFRTGGALGGWVTAIGIRMPWANSSASISEELFRELCPKEIVELMLADHSA